MPGSRFPHLPLPPLFLFSFPFFAGILRLEQILAAPASPAMGASCQNEKANAAASSLAASPSSWFLAPGHPNKIRVDLGWERADPHRNPPLRRIQRGRCEDGNWWERRFGRLLPLLPRCPEDTETSTEGIVEAAACPALILEVSKFPRVTLIRSRARQSGDALGSRHRARAVWPRRGTFSPSNSEPTTKHMWDNNYRWFWS